jgi:hypothetical protein
MSFARLLNHGAANSARTEVQEGKADPPAPDEGGSARRRRRWHATHASRSSSLARWILIRVEDDREMRAIEYHLGGLRSATGVRPFRAARDTTKATVGVPPLIRAHAWNRAFRRTGGHR